MNHAEESIAYYLEHYSSCRLAALNALLFCLSGGAEWNTNGQLDNCSSEVPPEKWYPPGDSPEEAKEFHDGNDAFERAYYAENTWHNWFDAFDVMHFHIGAVPDNVSDDWLAVCIEACEAYLAVPKWMPKIAIGFDYSGVTYTDDGEQVGEMQRIMEPWRSDPELKLDKPAVTKILEKLLAIRAERDTVEA
jgi:hypothetical protein